MDFTNYTFGIMNRSNIFAELREVSYYNADGKLYYYDPRDDDYWPVEKFVREIHGKYAKVEDHLYIKDVSDGWKRFAM
jgi:hypothetical protein